MKVDEAEALYESVARSTEGFTRDREGGDDDALASDGVFARVVLAGGSHLDVHEKINSLLPATGFTAGNERGRMRLGARHMVAVRLELRARPLQRVPAARRAGPGQLRRGAAVRQHRPRRLPRDGRDGRRARQRGRGPLRARTTDHETGLRLRPLPGGLRRRGRRSSSTSNATARRRSSGGRWRAWRRCAPSGRTSTRSRSPSPRS